jgi:cell wall-associated NlpC family hydrolase
MPYGLIINSIVPLRRFPEDPSEMETQLLFGETFTLIDKKNQWRKIRNDFDGYEGWIDEKCFIPLTKTERQKIKSATGYYVADMAAPFLLPDGTTQWLVKGSRLFFFNTGTGIMQFKDIKGRLKGNTVHGKQSGDFFFRTAESYLNAPYLWGGVTPFGIDCSGLTQMLFKISGRYNLPRNASQQAQHGERIDFADRQPGDLAFFVNEKGKIHHVGIVWFDGKILHAHGKVRIDELHPEGIFNRHLNRITHTLVLIKRI